MATRRRFLRTLGAGGLGLLSQPAAAGVSAELEVGNLLLLGFTGHTIASDSAQILAEHLRTRRVAGVAFVKENIGSLSEIEQLVSLFKQASPQALIAIDHEGGAVQRLREQHGFTSLPPALWVAENMDPSQAKAVYSQSARDLARAGFNINLAPVVDLHDSQNPAIGHWGRAFNSDPNIVARYAKHFIDAFSAEGITCVIKHFPGHGRSKSDSHGDLPDITATWSEQELEPYISLILSGAAKIIMGGHLYHANLNGDGIATTLSRNVITNILRNKLKYHGIIITDDIDMKAISVQIGRREAILNAVAAGNDIVVIRNATDFDPTLPQECAEWIRSAVSQSLLDARQITESSARVAALRASIVSE